MSASQLGAPASAGSSTRRVVLDIDGQQFDSWTSVRIVRALHEICGSFELEYLDTAREAEAQTSLGDPQGFGAIERGMACRLLIDGELVLVGWIDRVKLKQTATSLQAAVSGRDVCGDLVDCAAAPTGPAEFTNLDLGKFATQLCKPFGIGVQVQTDIGAPFPKISITPHEHVLPSIDKAARQRSVLITSDGVANLVLTTAGSTRAPDQIQVGVNVVEVDYEDDGTHRFSDIYVKGQTARARGNHAGVHCLHSAGSGTGAAPPDSTATTREAAGIVMTGHAQDPEITRYRPEVRMVQTQSGSSTVQQQAEWHVRVDRGQSLKISYTVLDWRAGDARALWRPNQLAAVYDPYDEIDDDMLIAGVTYSYSAEGARTTLSVVGKTAYDRINEPARRRPRHGLKKRVPKVVPLGS